MSSSTLPEVKRRRWPRKMTWALIAWTGLCLIWAISGAASDSSSLVADCVKDGNGFLTQSDCQTATDVGTGIGVTLIGGLWFVGFLVLSIVWFMTRPRGVGQIEATQ